MQRPISWQSDLVPFRANNIVINRRFAGSIWYQRTQNVQPASFQAIMATRAEVAGQHLRRDFGASGFREVTLDVFNGNVAMCSYSIYHVWIVQRAECSSIYYLTDPPALAGTALLLVERSDREQTDVWLRLRTAPEPLRLEPSRSRQFMLGTDFTYDDLRFWLPVAWSRIEITGQAVCHDEPAILMSTSASLADEQVCTLRIALHEKCWLPLHIEWVNEAGECVKMYAARHLTCIQNIWTPTEIAVARPMELYRSVMTLRRVAHNIDIDKDFFAAGTFYRVPASVFEKWRAESHTLP